MARQRLDSLTGLRAVAAFTVFIFHAEWLFEGRSIVATDSYNVPVRQLFHHGYVAVSFFFILSGFVLAWSWTAATERSEFYRRRFARVYPSHFATWLLALILILAGVMQQEDLLAAAVLNLLLLQTWLPLELWHSMNGSSWSLGCELFFYAMFPAIIWRLRPMGERRRRGVLVAMIAIVWAIPIALLVLQGPQETQLTVYMQYFPPARLPEFVIGMLLGMALRRGELPRIPKTAAFAFAVIAFLGSSYAPPMFNRAAITLIPFMVVLVAYAQNDLEDGRSFFRSKVMVHLGEISFAFYLVHEFMINPMHDRLLGPYSVGETIGLVTLMLALSVAGAEVLHFGVERPCQRYFSRPRTAAPTSA